MRKLDLFWMSDDAWWELKDHIPTVKASAPPEAQQSYARYLMQKRQTTGEYPEPEEDRTE